MTHDDIIRMAQKAGLTDPDLGECVTDYGDATEGVLRFAELVAAAEREACAELVWPTQQIKLWSEEELAAMTGAFNKAQEKHGWYESIMAVGAAALKGRAAAIRARGEK